MSKFKKKKGGDHQRYQLLRCRYRFYVIVLFYGSYCNARQHFNGFKHPACNRSGSKADKKDRVMYIYAESRYALPRQIWYRSTDSAK